MKDGVRWKERVRERKRKKNGINSFSFSLSLSYTVSEGVTCKVRLWGEGEEKGR